MDITFQVVSPNGAMLVNDEKRSDEVHTITTLDSGIYSFCFDNSFSRLAQKVVYVDLDLADAYSDEEDAWLKTLGEPDIQEKDLHIESIRVIVTFINLIIGGRGTCSCFKSSQIKQIKETVLLMPTTGAVLH